MCHEQQSRPVTGAACGCVTVNPCVACAPLGAALVFKGIEGGMAVLHGSQGCATYIRRYLISHFREPVDIASSSFTEETVVFGGEANLVKAVRSVCNTYRPRIIGIATTCLAETIGEDLSMLVQKIKRELGDDNVDIIPIHSPSYKDSHVRGYDSAVRAVLEHIPQNHAKTDCCGIVPGMLSPQDMRTLKHIALQYSVPLVVFPDYSETLDAGLWDSYRALPPGGTKQSDIASLSGAQKLIDWTASSDGAVHAFAEKHGVPFEHSLPPIGIKATDLFCNTLSSITGIAMPLLLQQERARLLDSYVDGHKYVSGYKVAVCCDEPLVRALTVFCMEIGLIPVLVATGRAEQGFIESMERECKDTGASVLVLPNADFDSIDAVLGTIEVDLCIGTSKLQRFAEKQNIPLVRVGFPVHDRFGASRIAHIGYKGSQELFDRIVNELMAVRQVDADEQWSYI
jgi:nitrogenase molybdenum-iron protein NifN